MTRRRTARPTTIRPADTDSAVAGEAPDASDQHEPERQGTGLPVAVLDGYPPMHAREWAAAWSHTDVVASDVTPVGTIVTRWRGLDYGGTGCGYVTELHPVGDDPACADLRRWDTLAAATAGHAEVVGAW